MKRDIFISYSTKDKDKVDLIAKLLENDDAFDAVIIASDREALKPLAHKVADGISRSHFIVPILTRNSINTQWINQEIGFATALNKPIFPIVEVGVIDELKGFIHKQIDLPYSYASGDNHANENREFLRQFKLLIADLPAAVNEEPVEPPVLSKTEFERSLDDIDRLYGEESFRSQRDQFVHSEDGHRSAAEEFNRLIDYAETKASIARQKLRDFVFEKSPNKKSIVMKSNNHSVTFTLERRGQYINEQESTLFVIHWLGSFSYEPRIYFFEGSEPKRNVERKFLLDLKSPVEICWTETTRAKPQFSSEKLVDDSITKLLEDIVKSRRSRI